MDLHDWIYPLNLMEKAVRQVLVAYPQILLVHPVDRRKSFNRPKYPIAESMEDLQKIPEMEVRNIKTILQFQAGLLRNATSKSLYGCVEKMADLLAAADDDLADTALSVLMSLAVPPDLYKQQSPDSSIVNASTALHTSKTQSHARLTACAVGWGTRAQGLGLEAVVTADDASDPPEAGFLDFSFYEAGAEEMSRIFIEPLEMFRDKDEMSMEEAPPTETNASKKRRRVMETKSTAELFFHALQKAGGRSRIPGERLFSLLADIRLARSFHSRALRVRAVERRLKALITITHAHPSQEVMTGYFQAQPELCVEIVDLLRPTISSSHVSANSANPGIMHDRDAVAGLAQGTSIPPQIQILAVELLTALVCRRDGSTAALSGSSRSSGVFTELGLGKGQYMGVLPTLVRYSLAALTADPLGDNTAAADKEDPIVEIGLDFVRATMAPLPPRPELVLRALKFVEKVLTLTSTIVSNAAGASALTEGGLVPSVLSLIAIPSEKMAERLLGSHKCDHLLVNRIRAEVRFVTAQVLQILEACVVTHSNSLTAFHDLQGVESLVSRLASEMDVPGEDCEDSMETDEVQSVSLCFSHKVLLYGLYTCLTVVFHQEPSSALAAVSSQTGSAQLRKPVMTKSVKKVMRHIKSYGGQIAYLVSTLLADVMNNDPQIVRHVHSSGIAEAVLSMMKGVDSETGNPIIPAVGDLVTALPNVISALALTEDGAQAVFDANPFPALLRVYHHPNYSMPRNRCLLNDNTSFIGTGLEEVMRHVDKLKPLIIDAVVVSLKEIKQSADEICNLERSDGHMAGDVNLIDARSSLIQYILNAGQILEHILHNEDNITPFVDAGGLDAVLDLFRSSLPKGKLFLAHVSALSSPSVSTLHHSTIEDVLFMALRCIVVKYDPVKVTKMLAKAATDYLDCFDASRLQLVNGNAETPVLASFPTKPLHEIVGEEEYLEKLASFLWDTTCVQWISCCIGMTIKTILRRGDDPASSSRRHEREWEKEIASESFRALLQRLANVHQNSVLEVCQVRGTSAHELREKTRLSTPPKGVKFRLRIVCPEGAIVRDGIEIDSCASVGSMSMGEVAEAYDRCINSSGILRYRTGRGWVSEMTRGHGREPIAEVMEFIKWDDTMREQLTTSKYHSKRLESSLPDLQSVGCGVLARLQNSHHEIISSLSKVSVQGVRTLDTGSLAFDADSHGGVTMMTVTCLGEISKGGFELLRSRNLLGVDPSSLPVDDAGVAMYLGFLIDSLHSCLFDERRERRIVNLPLLINLLSSCGLDNGETTEGALEAERSARNHPFGFMEAIGFLFEHCLHEFAGWEGRKPLVYTNIPVQRVSRSVASIFSPLVRFIRRLVCTPISLSPLASILSRLKWDQIPSISGTESNLPGFLQPIPGTEFFEPEHFASGLHIYISDLIHKVWVDPRIRNAPPYLMHPVATLVGEIIVALEDSSKKKPKNKPAQSRGQLLSDWIRGSARQQQQQDEEFEPSDEAIQRLQEMGFDRDHALEALESTRSNRVEVAMEYALSHPPPSPETAERRRTQRAERLQRREEQRQSSQPQAQEQNGNDETSSAVREGEADHSGEDTSPKDAGTTDELMDEKPDNDNISASQDRLSKWVEDAAPVCCGILTEMCGFSGIRHQEDGDAETEAMAVVLCSFLFDLCHRYPDKNPAVAKNLLDELKRHLSSNSEVVNERAISALCHSVVIFMRALPKTRLLVLESCLVGSVVELVTNVVGKKSTQDESAWPQFFASSLLFLEVMAQPVVAFAGKEPLKNFTEFYKDNSALPAELGAVFRQHTKQKEAFSQAASRVFSLDKTEETGSSEMQNDATSVKSNPFELVPSFYPLLPPESVTPCVDICKKVLSSNGAPPPPGITHGALSLLLQLLRNPRLSSDCLKDGMAEEILDLPSSSRFTGNTGLVTLILRRLLEDEVTLQTALENEIKTAIAKIQAADKDNSRSTEVSIPLKKFMEAITPLICRDQMLFLKAMSLTLKITAKSSDGDVVVQPLTLTERAAKNKSLAEVFPVSKDAAGRVDPRASPNGRRRSASGGTPKGKAFSKNVRRLSAKKARSMSQTLASPSLSVVSLMINLFFKSLALEEKDGANYKVDLFLTSGELLDILADLIVAVPACSSIVHNYRPFKNKDKLLKNSIGDGLKHALSTSVQPPKTLVSFLLHFLLAQDRWSFKFDSRLWERRKEHEMDDENTKAKKRRAHRLIKTTQAAGRIFTALAVRPGDSRKRVIEDLVFALSGGRLGHGSPIAITDTSACSTRPTAIHALHAWGELCLGLIAPRGGGKTVEGSSSIRVENVKIMLESGMVHALFFALHNVPLTHPMASSTCESLLIPIEVLLRPTVSSAVKDFSKKDASKDPQNGNGESEIAEGSGVGHSVAAGDTQMEYEEFVNVDNQEHDSVVDEEMGVDVGNDEESAGSALSHEHEGEEESSIEESESEMDDDDDGEEEEEDEEDSSVMDDAVEMHSAEVDDAEGWMDGNDDLVVYEGNENPALEDGNEEVTDRIEQGIDEGWTRVDSTGFGGMFMGGNRQGMAVHAAGLDERNRGFIDAAEVMIGSLLRTGEISSDAIAEIEGTLGVRITHNMGAGRPHVGGRDGLRDNSITENPFQNGSSGRRREAIGTVPHVHQRSQPEVGYSFVSNSSRLVEVSSLEFVFGGPCVTSGNRNYDTVSPLEDIDEDEIPPTLSQFDLQLFPGGPAGMNGGSTQLALHPLLCGVDLPPVNSIVSDLLPHGIRARRPGHLSTRRPGEWTGPALSQGGAYLVSTSNGNIIRSNRSQTTAPLGSGMPNRDINRPVGRTDDGLPFDSSVADLTIALGNALTASAERPAPLAASLQPESEPLSPNGRSEEHNNDGVGDQGQENLETHSGDEDEQMAGVVESPTDGDQVASSLAAGLRLSSEPEGNHELENTIAEREAAEPEATEAAEPETTEATEPEARPEDSAGGEMEASLEEAHAHQPETEDEPANQPDEPGSASPEDRESSAPNANGFVCPPEIDPEVFESLPADMQQDLVSQHAATQELAAQVQGTSIDPDVLAELPEDIRNDILAQQRRERDQSGDPPADPAVAEQMDNASFLASLEPELREEILLTADEAFLSSLPSAIRAEADVLRERAMAQRRTFAEPVEGGRGIGHGASAEQGDAGRGSTDHHGGRRRQRTGKIKVDLDRDLIVSSPESLAPPVARADVQLLTTFLYLLSPIRQNRLLQQLVYSMSTNEKLRALIMSLFVSLLHNDKKTASDALATYAEFYENSPTDWRYVIDKLFLESMQFPPHSLIGAAPELPESDIYNLSVSASLMRRKHGSGTAASAAAHLPKSSGGPSNVSKLPPVVTGRLLNILLSLCKNSPRFCLHLLEKQREQECTLFDRLLDLLALPSFHNSAANLDHLLTLLESVVSPLSHLARVKDEDTEISQKDLDAAASSGKMYMDVPRVAVNQSRLKLLCSILRMETCRDSAFTKVNTIIRRLCRVDENRGYVLEELASVAHGLGTDAVRDLRSLRIRMEQTAAKKASAMPAAADVTDTTGSAPPRGSAATSVALSTSASELKLLRVLQALHSLCTDPGEEPSSKKHDTSIIVTEELLHLLRQMQFDDLWAELSSCLKVVHVLEGVPHVDEEDGEGDEGDEGSGDELERGGRKLRNSSAGLLSRFLPAIEAFLIANASATRLEQDEGSEQDELVLENLVGGARLIEFVSGNRVLLNALVRNNASLLDKGLRALVQVPRCRQFLEFDVKRSWFKAQMRRLRQHASRRHGSLRLHIKRDRVFQEAYNYLRLRNADEMRGRLHVTFQNEEGVDAGGLSREFFAILAKEMFNPNYALFTATEDGCTFQPNQHSGINPDHLSFFRFVGRIVGKALADGYLLDAHFTRSLYKHMLGLQPTHPDMEAIDPDYYRNLKTILDYKLEDIGLDHLTFSIEDMSFGRTKIVDLIPNGRKIPVTEENKEEYVSKICQHRMTTAINNQIKAYLDGFHELINPELISIFTPRELELMISGLPDIDVDDLKKNTEYTGWRPADKEIDWFWKTMYSLSRDEKAKFLQFVTGSSKVPLAGFSELQGMRGTKKFTINKDSSGGSKGALMSAHTCFNTLDLPIYQSEEELKEKLLYAINEGTGAFLFA